MPAPASTCGPRGGVRGLAVAGLVALVAVGGGCGGGGAAGGESSNGRTLFVESGCGACHALRDAGTAGTVGPNLDDLSPGRSVVETFVRNGSAQMPAFENRLSGDQIARLADYVSTVAGSGGS